MRAKLIDAYYIPGVKMNKISCSRLGKHAVSIKIELGTCKLLDRSNSTILAKVKGRYLGGFFPRKLVTRSAAVTDYIGMAKNLKQHIKDQSISIQVANRSWNQRLAHGKDTRIRVKPSSKQYEMTFAKRLCILECTTCVLTKHLKSRCKGKLRVRLKTAALHADICGPMRTMSHVRSQYILAMTTAEQR